MTISLSEKCRARGTAESQQLKKSSYFPPLDEPFQARELIGVVVNWLTRIESILRNGLPTDDEAEASAIAHAHSELELLLESISHDGWVQ